jgi:diguanylate cyclase (GGDEF)-like protein
MIARSAGISGENLPIDELRSTNSSTSTFSLSLPPHVSILTSKQAAQLGTVHEVASPAMRPDERVRMVAARLAEIVGVKVAFVGRRGETWIVLAESSDGRLPFSSGAVPGAFARIAEALGTAVTAWTWQDREWTLVGLTTSPDPMVVLVLENDWTLCAPALTDLGRTLLSGRTRPIEWFPPHAGIAAHALTRALVEHGGLREACETVLRHVVRAVPSRLGAIALPTPRGDLSVVATHGYPLALVEHLRIAPGSGVIGAVFQSGSPMVVADVTQVSAIRHKRHRYRTSSFVAMPITSEGEVLGVLCLTDRVGDGAFSLEQVGTLRVLMTSAGMALGRERARRQAQAYAHAAIVDPVSTLFNRRYFEVRLDEELQRAVRQGTEMALLMIDIDEFKGINDTFGHVTGDTVIRDVAQLLRGSVRVFDVCARYGGEEFSVVMPGSSAESAALIAERIRERIAAYRPADHQLRDLRVTASFGVAESWTGATALDLIERADRALYAAKRAGSNRVVISGSSPP